MCCIQAKFAFSAGEVLRQDVLELIVLGFDEAHRVVDGLADLGRMGDACNHAPSCLGRHEEDVLVRVLVAVFLEPLALVDQLLVALLELVGDVLEEDKPQHHVFVLRRIHVAAQLVSSGPYLLLEANLCGVVCLLALSSSNSYTTSRCQLLRCFIFSRNPKWFSAISNSYVYLQLRKNPLNCCVLAGSFVHVCFPTVSEPVHLSKEVRMTHSARLSFNRRLDGLKEGGAGELTQSSATHDGAHSVGNGTPHVGRLVASKSPGTFDLFSIRLLRHALSVLALGALTVLLTSFGVGQPSKQALAAQTVRFENGGTAQQNDDGTLTGTCYLRAIWAGLATTYSLTMPDGQVIPAHCIDFGLVDPADDNYDFTAYPVGDGSYNVHTHSDRAGFYQTPTMPRVPAGGAAIQRVNSDQPWRANIVRGGFARIKKVSSDDAITNALGTYALRDARFSIWRDEACTISASDAILTTQDDGMTPPAELEAGTYWAREDSAPAGFAKNDALVSFSVNPGETTVTEFVDRALYVEAPVLARKVTSVSDDAGTPPLANAEFTVTYFDGYHDVNSLPSSPTRTWILKSDANGNVTLNDNTKVSGDAFYTNVSNAPVLPLGTIAIQETKAPEGFFLEGQTPDSASNYTAPCHVYTITGSGGFDAPLIANQMRRAGISIQKHDSATGTTPQGDATLAGMRFQVVNANQTPVMVNGVSYGPGAVIGNELVTNEQGQASTASDYLPLGTYEIRESSSGESYVCTAPPQRVELDTQDTNTIVRISKPFANEVVRGGVRVAKYDRELKRAEPQGDASLGSTTFTITLDSNNPVVVNGKTYSRGQSVMTISTNELGIAQTGANALPFGTYTVRESSAPTGYHPNTSYSQSFSIRSNGEIVDLTNQACDDQVIRGGVQIGKIDRDLDAAHAQGDAGLAGAVFSIYLASSHPVVVDGTEYATGAEVKAIRTNDGGIAATGTHDLPYGTYRIRETVAPQGYLLNDSFEREFKIRSDGTVEQLGSRACVDSVIRGSLAVGKVSRETSLHVGQGEASLKGAQLSVSLDSEQPVVVQGNTYQRGDVVCTLTTDENGYACTDDRFLPYGTYVIREVEPPAGFLPNEDWSQTASIREDGVTVDLSGEPTSVDDQVMRGGFSFNKVDESTMERLGNTAFRITSTTTGESHIAVTDENGFFDTESNPHSKSTNANDGAVSDSGIVSEGSLDANAGIWFSGGPSFKTVPEDTMGALPYDVYEVSELRSSANKDRELVSFVIRTHSHEYFVNMGTVDDRPITTAEPTISTTLTFDGTQHIAPVSEHVTLTDEVRYEGLVPKQTYELIGELMDKDTGEMLRTPQGEAVTATTTFTPRTTSGTVKLSFEFDSRDAAGKTTVAFEYLKLDGTPVTDHTDLEDTEQTVRFPSVHTTLDDGEGNHEVSVAEEQVSLIDTVRYENLEPGLTYELAGTMMDKRTGDKLTDYDGRQITAYTTFVPEDESGTVEVPFQISSTLLKGKTVVAFEQLKRAGIVLASHEDFADEGQTVSAPSICTELTGETEEHCVPSSDTIVLVDTITYTNLIPGATYEVRGTIHDKTTGEALRTPEGALIEAATTFLAEAQQGVAVVNFTLDGTAVTGKSLVAFETLRRDGRDLAVHADIDDEAQTVYVPSIRTTLCGNGDAHEVLAAESIQLVDTVTYEGLEPHTSYRMRGRLVDVQTGETLHDKNNAEIIVEEPFEAETSSGQIALRFTIDARDLAGKTVVCFEQLITGTEDFERIVARHEDPRDANQTVTFPKIATSASDAEDGDGFVLGTGIARIRDEVEYHNLRPGIEYTMNGTLYDKQTNAAISDKDGHVVSAQTKFVPKREDGSVVLEFVFDASHTSSTSAVVFESCLRNDVEVAVHANINDESQTVRIARIKTEATEKNSGKHEADASGRVELVDEVSFEGLLPGIEYELIGTLYNKQTGKQLEAPSGTVTARLSFTPQEESGTVKLPFAFDAQQLDNTTVVVFERLMLGGKLAASHEDLADEAQSVALRKQSKDSSNKESSNKEPSNKESTKTSRDTTKASGTSAATEKKDNKSSTPHTGDALAFPFTLVGIGSLVLIAGKRWRM